MASCLECKNDCMTEAPSEGLRTFEPMFDSSKRLSIRIADAVDLLIDFTTLGEYGLEPVAETVEPECGARRRSEPLRRGRSGSGIRFAAVDRRDHLTARL